MTTASLPRRIGKWAAILIAGLLALLLIALAVLYFLSERLIDRERIAEGTAVAIPTDPQALAEGERLANITGCNGCHAPDLGGQVFFDGGLIMARLVAPNLTTLFRDTSIEDLERAVRKGIGVDGRTLAAMPSGMYRNLSDEHLGRIFAWIRTVPVVERDHPRRWIGPLARVGLLAGELELDADVVARLGMGNPDPDLGEEQALGSYLAHIACTECHGHDLTGNLDIPNLAVARAYTPEEFTHLMRTGEALGGRELNLMSSVARSRFRHFTDAEIRALHGYLVRFAESQQDSRQAAR